LTLEGSGSATSGIFISYRRDDDPGHALLIYKDLAERFGEPKVFMDVDAIEPGVNFVERIQSAVATADALVVIIGRSWLTAADADGQQRLDDPRDFVRVEVGTALQRGIRVIPVLVGGAVMPTEEQLPSDLAALSSRHALVASDLDWEAGASRLVRTLEHVLGQDGRRREGPGGVLRAALALEILGAALLLLGTALRADSFLHPDFGAGNAPHLGFFTSVAPIGVVLAAIGALALSHTGWELGFSLGLLIGCGLDGAVKYVGVLGMESATGESEPRLTLGAGLALVGSLVLAGVASWRAFAELRERPAAGRPASLSVALVALGASLTVAGTLIAVNDGPGITQPTLIERGDHWEAFEPIAVAVLAVLAAALLAGRRSRLLGAGVLVALGTLSTLLWLRYVGVPILQPDTVSSPAAGSFIGLAGAGLILFGGGFAAARASSGFAGRVPAGRAT
jgi:TIR domain